MRGDVGSWCHACEVCTSRQVDRAIRPPLVPLPVEGAFDCGVDVLLIQYHAGNQYVVVFVIT